MEAQSRIACRVDPAEVHHCGHEVNEGRQRINVLWFDKPAIGPTDKERYTMPSVILRAFPAPKTGIVTSRSELVGIPLLARCAAIIGHKDKNGVVGDSQFIKVRIKPTEVVVDVGDHSKETLTVVGMPLTPVAVVIGSINVIRRMRCVRSDETDEGLVLVTINEAHALPEPDIRAVAVELAWLAVDHVGIVKVIILPPVRHLADSASAMRNDLLEAPVLGAIRVVVAQMPFAEETGGVAVFGKHVGNGHFIATKERTPAYGMPHPG